MKKVEIPRICKGCGVSFISIYKTKVFHSRDCYDKFYAQNNNADVYGNHLSTGTLGAIAEIEVSIHLMSKGFEVYRAMSPSSSCDIIAFKNGVSYPIEVRSAIKTFKGRIAYAKFNMRAPYLALYFHSSKEVIFIPDLLDVLKI